MLLDSAWSVVHKAPGNKIETADDAEDVDEEEQAANVRERRKVSHFHYTRNGVSMPRDRFGKTKSPDSTTGDISRNVLEAMEVFEPAQQSFSIWCEAKLPNGDYVCCWPQYRSDQGLWYDWVMIGFPSDNEETIYYPAKVLALYEDDEGELKAIVHSVAYKTATCVESELGDSTLITHYRLEFQGGRGSPSMRSVLFRDIQ